MMTLFTPADCLILVVDDLPTNLRIVGDILDKAGYATTFATTGEQAIARARSAKPDLILLDLRMPDMDGLQVCEALKADPELQSIPIIFISASDDRQNLLNAFDKGAVDYISKPFHLPELLARVKTHLQLRHTTNQLRATLAEVERLARIDSLTEVLNRRSLLEAAEQEFNRARRYGSIFSVLMLDIDYFKQINDTYGHATGDVVLRSLTYTISNLLRNVDIFGRYGGEEFLILLPETDLEPAMEVAERIRRCVADQMILSAKQSIHITVSLGLATIEAEDVTIEQIIDRADKALYHSKAMGRNVCSILKRANGQLQHAEYLGQ